MMEGGLSYFHKQVIETAPVVIALLDREHRCYRFFSPYVSTVLGYTPEELTTAGSDVFESILDPEGKANWAAHLESLDEGADDHIVEILLQAKHKCGDRKWLLCRDRVYLRGPDGRAAEILSMAMDVTLLMETRRKIIESRNQAEAASRAKDEFMALISHELHTPLNAVFGGAQLLQHEAMTQDQAECRAIILEGAENLKALFADLLEYSQAQTGMNTVADEEIHLVDELEMIQVRGMEMADDRNLGWRFQLAHDLPRTVWGDRTRLLMILRHLLENAMKFTERGEVVLSASIPRRRGRDLWLEIAVKDTGVGIAREVQERMFDPFQQGDEIDTRRFEGTGIGLTIAQRHAVAMGGRIEVESREGEGSCFRVTLPFRIR